MRRRTSETGWPDVALIGSYPPPYGGISVHLQRLVEFLQTQDINVVLYNTVSASCVPGSVVSVSRHKILWFLRFCLRHRCRIVHLESCNWFSRLLFGIMARFRKGKYLISIQGRSITEALRVSRLRSGLTRWVLRQMDMVIASNEDIERECLDDVGLPRENVRMIPAFIPPDPDNAPELPEYVVDFLETHSPLISSVGWIGQINMGSDLYGIDMMIELVDLLKEDYPNIGFVLSINGGQKADIERLVTECRERVGDRFLAVQESLPDIGHILRSSDLFVRPTNTDGDSVSVREALYLGTPVVASDAVPRPDICRLFATRDTDAFAKCVRKALTDLPALKKQVEAVELPDNAWEHMKVYKELECEL